MKLKGIKVEGKIKVLTDDNSLELGKEIADRLWEPINSDKYRKGYPALKPKDMVYLSNILSRNEGGDREFDLFEIAQTEFVTARTAYEHCKRLVQNGLLKAIKVEGEDDMYKVDYDGMYDYCGATFVYEEDK